MTFAVEEKNLPLKKKKKQEGNENRLKKINENKQTNKTNNNKARVSDVSQRQKKLSLCPVKQRRKRASGGTMGASLPAWEGDAAIRVSFLSAPGKEQVGESRENKTSLKTTLPFFFF